jgi:hypothetical protein
MIIILVEGPGDKRSVPFLLKRRQLALPVRCVEMKGKSNIVREHHGFEDTVRRQQALGEKAFVVLVDGDVTFAPYRSLDEERAGLAQRAQALQNELGVSVEVCWAVLTAESWLVGGITPKAVYCGLQDISRVPANTETEPQDPKGWLENHLSDQEYAPAVQECLAQHVDVQEAQKRNHSMQTFFGTIEMAHRHQPGRARR